MTNDIESPRLIYIHGLQGTSQGVKANLLRELFPDMVIPDFSGSLQERMAQLVAILGEEGRWKMVGSSFGGLMAVLYACQRPERVERLVLLAPALIWPDFAASSPAPVTIPTVIYHGRQDTLIPAEALRPLAEALFPNLEFHLVDDDHGLYQTAQAINWRKLLG
ncbi:MAG: alpha/beta fold hydrolase [Anaerolineales bacterium]|nr:alpha/beta fold hydrolase [Anaerolineales bacterium]